MTSKITVIHESPRKGSTIFCFEFVYSFSLKAVAHNVKLLK